MEEPRPDWTAPGYPPPIPPPPSDQRVRTLAILDIVFSVLYLGCSIYALSQLGLVSEDLQRQADSGVLFSEAVLTILFNGLCFLGLLIAGILLFRKIAVGRTLTLAVGGMAVVYVVVDAILTVVAMRVYSGQFDEASFGGLVVGSVLGLLIRPAYPIVSAILLLRPPEQLGLE